MSSAGSMESVRLRLRLSHLIGAVLIVAVLIVAVMVGANRVLQSGLSGVVDGSVCDLVPNNVVQEVGPLCADELEVEVSRKGVCVRELSNESTQLQLLQRVWRRIKRLLQRERHVAQREWGGGERLS